MLIRMQKGQSVLEYAVLIGVVASGIIIMQAFVKRGFQGRLKSSADGISGGRGFSASGTTEFRRKQLTSDQEIIEEVGTSANSTATIGHYGGGFDTTDVQSRNLYSMSRQTGGNSTSETSEKTESATQEAYDIADYNSTDVGNFTTAIPFTY